MAGKGAVPVTDTPEQYRLGRAVDRTISATCQLHGARGFCNLRVTKVGDGIMLDPHVGGSCVLTLNGAETAALRNVLIEWRGEGSR